MRKPKEFLGIKVWFGMALLLSLSSWMAYAENVMGAGGEKEKSLVPAHAPSEAVEPETESQTQYGEITGTISAVSKHGIAIEYARTRTTSSEMYLPLGDHLKLERIGDLDRLKPGDTVGVQYERMVKRQDRNAEPVVLKTTATGITLLKQAPEEGALVSKERVPE